MHVMHVMHAFHACHARMSRISRPCAQFRPCSPCSIRPLRTHFRLYFRAWGEGSAPIGGNSFQLSASSSHRWAGSSVPPAPVFSSLWRSIWRDSGAILSKKRPPMCLLISPSLGDVPCDVFFHYSHPPVYNLGHVPPAQPVPSGRISGSIFEPGAKDLPPLEAILFNCLPPAVIVGLAHPYRQHQCFRACGVVLGEIRAQSCQKTATSVPPAQSVRGRCPF